MSKSKSNLIYDVNEHVIEIYDQIETETHDIEFILDYIKDKNIDRILEPFCGNGRMLIPLAEAGYQVVGMALSFNMLDSLKKNINKSKFSGHLYSSISAWISFILSLILFSLSLIFFFRLSSMLKERSIPTT